MLIGVDLSYTASGVVILEFGVFAFDGGDGGLLLATKDFGSSGCGDAHEGESAYELAVLELMASESLCMYSIGMLIHKPRTLCDRAGGVRTIGGMVGLIGHGVAR